ncbi:PREDICTED: serine/threonine-protein phosphatase 1 regulatory subunit 10 [Dufourea novaeangliae]|uniref:Serine/threonine-protein phosphatase 1 regulatory subunit 10 n=1 Tax=Dufourea novaeangliae TaxID=178035 RepID=A0A154PED5_DUFNO|nr:PREDICTED: serine/threonine-protein phosphatase 1 regulatory subunit 10 [Dufourea novaeangliae]XP_015431435.1 PREDICTED: serine/threonine-protein phosphatase 1 regulatory subunit 10 [Dufourea novaeangliae]XP_015431436.1 PREDICTED: serine/threonine-protein phosphatase 1 regulatory subunit 10 [Dufourea novaeangliae]KZC09570.1 Serine/threonine-protein phosphatase 1 regulatory subunit 10 [Dufourea novaeangliae]
MPRIDPLSLLKCLSVLLGPTGGIKSKEEVHRLANLMTKFSKKLVSKCIYIQILKTTNTDLLSQFMGAGGWNLIHMWLTDGILLKNWALIQELLELLLLCPVDIERLKSNNCPKLIKGLSKEGSHQGVRVLASQLVEQWLKIVKGEAAPNSVPAQIVAVSAQDTGALGQNIVSQTTQQQQYSIHCGIQQVSEGIESATVHVQDLQFTPNSTSPIAVSHIQQQLQQAQEQQQQQSQERTTIQPLQLQVVSKPQQVQIQQQLSSQQSKKPAFVVVSTSSQSPIPVYKITIREGKQILTKVETDTANINSVLNTNSTKVEINGGIVDNTLPVKEISEEAEFMELSDGVVSGQDFKADVAQSEKFDQVSSEVKQTLVDSIDITDVEVVKNKENKDSKDTVSSEISKSSNKENRDSSKRDEKKSSSSDKKSHHSSSSSSKSSSKHTSSSSSHRSSSTSKSSSHRSSSSSSSSSKSSSSKDKSSKDRDKHHSSGSSSKHSSSSKSKSDKEREKEKQKKDQAEKDKATLEKVQGQALSSKLGKIPKKKSEEEKPGDAAVRKSSTDSRDSSKENKTDSKKVVAMPEKKNISISIESRKNSQDSTTRPKTVKTFNSKFRSTGLEEEVKPPPPRSAKKPNPIIEKKVIPQKLPVLKRPSPLREAIPTADKRAKLSLDSPTTPPSEEKKGGIKLIPPKPKPMVLQESDMFMDALTASTKSKEPRKRKRRTSITKDGPSEPKKQETAANDNRDVTPPPTSPPSADEKSPVVVKPNFKFYQDTLETDEDKEQKEKENSDDDVKKDKEEADDQKENRIFKPDVDDDAGSNTPTPDDDVEEKADSPDDSSVSDSTKKENTGSYPEIRYVDGLRSVLLLQKRKGPKKVLKWKTDIESVRYFELDETERVNVTKTFTDMKQMEKQNEREAFQMARKLSTEDLMEERTRWKPLIPIDLPPALVESGKDSREKDIQYAREKGILQALYFNRSMIPDSAAEPDEERHHIYSDPKIIPLDDLTGNKESEKDFTSMAWPEPKPQLQPQTPPVSNFHYPSFPHNQQPVMTPMGPQTSMGPIPQMPPQMMGPSHMGPIGPEMGGPMPAAGGGWRTGDGKVVVPDGMGMNPMGNMPNAFPPGMEGGPMVPPGMMGPPPMYNQQQEGYGMMGPEDMGFNNMNPNNFQGPPGPMYGPGPNFQGPRGGGPMHGRGRGVPGPGWYRGGGGPPGRGGWRGGGGWRGSGKQPPVCRQFSKNGYCRVGDKCQYLHPGVNCPPF